MAQGGVAHVNHPNYLYTLTIDDLLASGEVGLLEVANGHNAVHNEGDATHPSTEVIWDTLLASGRQVWGVASDDAHYFQTWGENYSNPVAAGSRSRPTRRAWATSWRRCEAGDSTPRRGWSWRRTRRPLPR